MHFTETINIQEFMEVFGSCGNRIGHVDSVDDSAILLLNYDFADGRSRHIPLEWVDRVGKNVYLNKSYKEVSQRWTDRSFVSPAMSTNASSV